MLDNVRTEVLVNKCYVLLYGYYLVHTENRYYLVHFDSWMLQFHYVKYHLGF